ncbi:uncharacterized protein LOC141823571 [Curcuma longa]|uniref:uncharacterized protein LOC141823571 n=1 Tax=Curcuma longa TaxID=136217 RepID=UPI003D9F3C3D
MSRAVHLRGVDSDEIDVFEATQYFSGRFIVHDDLCLRKDTREARAHRRVMGRRSLDTLIKTRLADKNYGKDKKQQQQQQQWPGGKMANFLTSLFRQTLELYKKRSRKTDRNLELEVQPKRGSSSSSGGSCYVSTKRSEEGYCRNKPSENYQKPASDHQGVVTHGVKYDEKEASSNSMSTRELMARRDHKEEYLVMVKELEEDGEGSDSSSDLFELESCHLQGDFSFDLPVYGSPNLHAWCLQS